jgi:hypothetical protein
VCLRGECRVNEHEARHAARVPRGEEQGRNATEAFTDQDGLFEAELIERGQNIHGLDLVGLTTSWVDAQDAKARRESGGERIDDVVRGEWVGHKEQGSAKAGPIA